MQAAQVLVMNEEREERTVFTSPTNLTLVYASRNHDLIHVVDLYVITTMNDNPGYPEFDNVYI